MATSGRDPSSFLPLTVAEFSILLELATRDLHGYALLQSIDLRSSEVRIAPATLYRSIKRLLEASLIQGVDERPDRALDDERRRYYKLTALGHQVAVAEALRLAHLVDAARDARLI